MTLVTSDTTTSPPLSGSVSSRFRWRTAFIVLAVFLSGGLIGAATTAVLLVRFHREIVREPTKLLGMVLYAVKSELDLTDEQAVRIEAVFTRHHRAIDAIRADVHGRFHGEIEALESEVAQELDEEQRAIWIKRFRAFRADWLPRPPAAPPAELGVNPSP